MRSRSVGTLLTLFAVGAAACGDSRSTPSNGGVAMDARSVDSASDAGVVTQDMASADAVAARQRVVIEFVALVGTAPFSCAMSYSGLGLDDSSVKPGDLRFYAQDVTLVDDEGRAVPVILESDGRWQQPTVGLLDFEDKKDECANGTEATNDRLIGSVPPGRYKGLRFVVGVPFELNHRPLTMSKAPLDLTALFWSWNSGHLFFKAEASALAPATNDPSDAGADGGATDALVDAGDAATIDGPDASSAAGIRRNVFVLHAGSTLCEGKATEGTLVDCKHPNRGAVDLPVFQPGSSRVVVDFAEIFRESRLQSLPGCHSFAGGEACVAPFDRIGVDWITGRPTAQTQKVFRVEQ